MQSSSLRRIAKHYILPLTKADEHTRVEGILTTNKIKKWTWAGHVMRRADNRWIVKVTEWQPRDGRRSQGRTELPLEKRDEVGSISEVVWITLTLTKSNWSLLRNDMICICIAFVCMYIRVCVCTMYVTVVHWCFFIFEP